MKLFGGGTSKDLYPLFRIKQRESVYSENKLILLSNFKISILFMEIHFKQKNCFNNFKGEFED